MSVLSDLQWEDNETVVGLLKQLVLKQGGGPTLKPVINYWSWIVVPVGNATVALATGQFLYRLGILQNVNNSATPPTTPITISDVKNKVPAGILNPPTTKGQAGGSWPVSSPSPTEFVDASGIFLTGQDAGDRVSFGYV